MYKLFTEKNELNKRGAKTSHLNSALVSHFINTKTTPDDAKDLFSAMGIPMPVHNFQQSVNQAGMQVIDLHKTVIQENRKVTELVATIADPQNMADNPKIPVTISFPLLGRMQGCRLFRPLPLVTQPG